MSEPSNEALLDGLKVLDLSQFVPGPYATRLFADLGADVIKVEPPRGDPMRTLLYQGKEALSPVYRTLNRGKRVLSLDLKASRDKQLLIELAASADVLLESFRPGVMKRLGLDWENMCAINPALIYCSLSGYGQQGPYREEAGHDINYCAAAGLFSPSQRQGNPMFLFPPIADHTGAMLAANSILSALYARSRNGSGRYLDVSIYESILAFRYLSSISCAGEEIGHVDFLCGNAACYNIYQTADHRFITLGAVERKFWQAFCEAMQQPDWIGRQLERFPQQALIGELQQRFMAHPLEYWNQLLMNVECCYQPIPLDHEVMTHPQTVDRRLADGNDIRYAAWIDGQPAAATTPLVQINSTESPEWLTP